MGRFDNIYGGTPTPGPVDGPAPTPSASRFAGLGGQAQGQRLPPSAVEPTETDNSGPGAGTYLAGGAALIGAAALASKLPGRAGKIFQGLNALRQQLMLSGFAPAKSVLGNVGAGIEQAVEGKGLMALKEILSPRTAREAMAAMKSPTALVNNPAGSGAINLPGILSAPGRFMGGMDEATRAALGRAGLTAKEAENAVLQSPLTGSLGEAFEGGVASYLFPFRRTPFNQFIEGLKRLPGGPQGRLAAQIAYPTVGAVHGAATADDAAPMSIPFAAAASARYGLPYVGGAILGRALAGGHKGQNLASSALPVSEYGLDQSISEPWKGFEPAALRAMKQMLGS